MYLVGVDVEAVPAVEALPPDALAAFLEVRAALEVAPHSVGQPLSDHPPANPTANMRTATFGPHRQGLVVWYTAEAERRVAIVSVVWLDPPSR